MDEPHYHGEVASILPDHRRVLAVDLLPSPFREGRERVIEITHWSEVTGNDEIFSVGILCPDDARSLARHLLNVADLADRAEKETRAGIIGVRQLPAITLCGSSFYIDERLRQLRNVENADHYFDLEDRIWQ